LFMGMLGGGVLVAPVLRASVLELIQPLAVGHRLGQCTITKVSPPERGALRIQAKTERGEPFTLEILARDRSPLAPRPPAETAFHAVFISNGGDGWSATQEEQGLAAMALAQVIAQNEGEAPIPGLLTHAERFLRHRG